MGSWGDGEVGWPVGAEVEGVGWNWQIMDRRPEGSLHSLSARCLPLCAEFPKDLVWWEKEGQPLWFSQSGQKKGLGEGSRDHGEVWEVGGWIIFGGVQIKFSFAACWFLKPWMAAVIAIFPNNWTFVLSGGLSPDKIVGTRSGKNLGQPLLNLNLLPLCALADIFPWPPEIPLPQGKAPQPSRGLLSGLGTDSGQNPREAWRVLGGWTGWRGISGKIFKGKAKGTGHPRRARSVTTACSWGGPDRETPYCGSEPASRSPEKPNSITLIRMPLNLTKQIISSRDRYCVGGQNYFASQNWRLKSEMFG